jgi:Bacterial Ig-like domain (group 1)
MGSQSRTAGARPRRWYGRTLSAVGIGFVALLVFGAAQGLAALTPFTSESGKVSLSVDAFGATGPVGTMQVQKHPGATVRKAYLFTATTGFSGYTPVNGEVTLNGAPVTWNPAQTITNGISSKNGEADVTAIVKPLIDAAPAGIVNVPITEANSGSYDGEILAVIFDDPTVPQPGTVILMYGAQKTSGDDFNVALSDPVDKTNPNFGLDLSLGISFGFQPASQFSTIDVNGSRMTSSAGGQDDGQSSNGALITAGGVGDLNDNPPNPAATDFSCVGAKGPAPLCDDELYSLLPFVSNGDTALSFHTANPSNDDNMFFAALNVQASAAIVGAGVVLGPAAATNPVGTNHTLTATVQNTNGDPVSGATVTFTAVSGPNAGLTHSSVTDVNGHATFIYSSASAGTDTWTASFTDTAGLHTSNQATKTWQSSGDSVGPMCLLSATVTGPPKQIQITVQDSGSGLQSVQVTTSDNADTVVPPFAGGTTSPVIVTSTKIDQSQSSRVALKVTDAAGNKIECDPIWPGTGGKLRLFTKTFSNVVAGRHVLRIYNAGATLRPFTISVNGKRLTAMVAPHRTRAIAVGYLLHRNRNVISVRASGKQAMLVSLTGR